MKKHRGRWLASGGVGLIVIAIVAASLASLQSRNSIYPILVQPCVGEVALRLHNGNLFWTVSYRLLVETGQYAAAQRNGSLAAGDNLDFRFLSPCGPHKVWISWDNGPWGSEEFLVEWGKTYPVYLAY